MKAAEGAKDLMLSDRSSGQKKFESLLAKHPGDGMVLFQRALAYESLGEIDLAIGDIRRAKALFPKTEWKQLADNVFSRLMAAQDAPVLKSATSFHRKKKESSRKKQTKSPKRRRVWVVHGRDIRLRAGMFIFLQSIGLQPLDFLEARKRTKKSSPYVGEILDSAFKDAQAVVVLLTPDDEARLKSELQGPSEPSHEVSLTGQARPNVLFEAGMAFMSHPDRTILVQFGEVRPFTDIGGKHIIHMDNSTPKRHELASRLEDAGCPVDWKRVEWHTAGDLNPKRSIDNLTAGQGGQGKLASENDDTVVRGRVREALEDKRFTWRTLAAIAAAAGVSEERAAEILRADPQVKFGRNSKRQALVGLLFRVE